MKRGGEDSRSTRKGRDRHGISATEAEKERCSSQKKAQLPSLQQSTNDVSAKHET